jgi:hypothetical protein
MNQNRLAPYSYRREMPAVTVNRVWWVVYKNGSPVCRFQRRHDARMYMAKQLGKPIHELWPKKKHDLGY